MLPWNPLHIFHKNEHVAEATNSTEPFRPKPPLSLNFLLCWTLLTLQLNSPPKRTKARLSEVFIHYSNHPQQAHFYSILTIQMSYCFLTKFLVNSIKSIKTKWKVWKQRVKIVRKINTIKHLISWETSSTQMTNLKRDSTLQLAGKSQFNPPSPLNKWVHDMTHWVHDMPSMGAWYS